MNKKNFLPMLLFFLGCIALLVHSSIQDLAMVLLSIGGLFTIWFKIGNLESGVKQIDERLSKLEDKHEKMIEFCIRKQP